MTATDELRRLLDERGVEWDELVGHPVVVGTEWYDRDGCPCTALEHADDVPDGMLNVQANLTPEQAIAATLGDSVSTGERHGVVWQCVLYDDLTDYPYADGYVYRRREDAEKRAKRMTYVDDEVRHWATVRKLITCW